MNITAWWRGRGQHRDPRTRADLLHLLEAADALIAHQAKQLIEKGAENSEVRRASCKAREELATTQREFDALQIQHEDLLDAYDQLAARYRDLAPVHPPEADTEQFPAFDPERTIPVVVPLQFAFAPNPTQAAA